jgi:autotransporter-associated beta strand protein
VGGSVTFTGVNTYTGTTTVNSGATLLLSGSGSIASSSKLTDNGTFDISATTAGASIKSLAGNGTVNLGSRTLTLTNANDTFAGTITGNGGLTLASGVETLSGTNSYLGPTTINSGGTLVVNGSITDPTVNSGGMLTGTGSVGSTTVNGGGVLAPGSITPGTSLAITGNLAFTSGALYVVTLNSTATTFANVTGTATLGGAVQAVLSPGTTGAKRQYDILHSAGLNGSTFSSVTSMPGFTTSLSYSMTDVFLNLSASLGAGTGLNTNQQNVATSLNNFFNSGGSLPPAFFSLFSLTGPALGNALTQISGEGSTATQQTTFQAMNLFMGMLTDPFMGRGGGINGSNSVTGYAEEGATAYTATNRSAAERDAYAMFTKAPLAKAWDPRWSVWASGFGGTQTTSGNAVVGSNDTHSSIYGTAVGADYLFTPNTLAGFALAGGGTGFAVANGLGNGRSDLFQAGAYLRHTNGPAYITAALAYGWQDITTDRTVTVAGIDHLRAQFNANAWSGRAEGGYRFVVPLAGGVGITPYAAAQFTNFQLPSYMEQAVFGANTFALGYAAKSVTDSRSELGVRTDKSFATETGVLTLRGRLAWAHDYNPDRSLLTTFQTLPGASFVVNGARQAADSALTTGSIEWKWGAHWSAAAILEGEYSNVTTSYASKGAVRYQW